MGRRLAFVLRDPGCILRCEFYLLQEDRAFVGMFYGIWHPTWVMFITIPVFYIIAEKIDRMTRTRDYAAIKNAYGKKDGKNPGHKGKDGFNR